MKATIDFGKFEKQIEQAGQTLVSEMKGVNKLRAAHAETLEALEQLRGEMAAANAIISEFEGDKPTQITAEVYNAALSQRLALGPQIKRAEAIKERASREWQQAERETIQHARARMRGILGDFDKEAGQVRDQYFRELQGQL